MQLIVVVLLLTTVIVPLSGTPVNHQFKPDYDVEKEGRCPRRETMDWLTLKQAADCDDGEEYHCAKNPLGQFIQACDKAIYCLQGKEPIIRESNNYKVSCEYCQKDKSDPNRPVDRYNPNERTLSSDFSQCPETQNFCNATLGTLHCQKWYGVEVYSTAIECRCDARKKLIPRNKNWNFSRGVICTKEILRCEKRACPNGQERMLNYTCKPVCKTGFHRTWDSDVCVASDTEALTASTESSTVEPSSPTTTTTQKQVTTTPVPLLAPSDVSDGVSSTTYIIIFVMTFVGVVIIITVFLVLYSKNKKFRVCVQTVCQKYFQMCLSDCCQDEKLPPPDDPVRLTMLKDDSSTEITNEQLLGGGATGGPGDHADRGDGDNIEATKNGRSEGKVEYHYHLGKVNKLQIGDRNYSYITTTSSSSENLKSENENKIPFMDSDNDEQDQTIHEGSENMLDPAAHGGATGGEEDLADEEPYHKKILDDKRGVLVEDMNPDLLLDQLTRVLDFVTVRDIRNQTTDSDKNRMIIDAVRSKGPEVFDGFKDCLWNTGQLHILDDPPQNNTGQSHLLEGPPENNTGQSHLLEGPPENNTGQSHLLEGPPENNTGQSHLLEGPPENNTGQSHLLDDSLNSNSIEQEQETEL